MSKPCEIHLTHSHVQQVATYSKKIIITETEEDQPHISVRKNNPSLTITRCLNVELSIRDAVKHGSYFQIFIDSFHTFFSQIQESAVHLNKWTKGHLFSHLKICRDVGKRGAVDCRWTLLRKAENEARSLSSKQTAFLVWPVGIYCIWLFIYLFSWLTEDCAVAFWDYFLLNIEVGRPGRMTLCERGIYIWHVKNSNYHFVLLPLIASHVSTKESTRLRILLNFIYSILIKRLTYSRAVLQGQFFFVNSFLLYKSPLWGKCNRFNHQYQYTFQESGSRNVLQEARSRHDQQIMSGSLTKNKLHCSDTLPEQSLNSTAFPRLASLN